MEKNKESQSEFLKNKKELFEDSLLEEYQQLNEKINTVLKQIHTRKNK